MKIAIHKKDNDFSSRWIKYCKNNDIQNIKRIINNSFININYLLEDDFFSFKG